MNKTYTGHPSMISHLSIAIATMVSILSMSSCFADLQLTIGSASISAGGSTTVDVLISSTTGADILQSFGVEYQITSLNGSSLLKFTDPQDNLELTDSNYVFSVTGSTSIDQLPFHSGGVGTTVYAQDQFINFDSSNSAIGQTISTSPMLLSRLQLFSDLASLPKAGDQFRISMIGTSADMTDNSFFLNENAKHLLFSSTFGTVTLAPAAVPEPSSLLMMFCLGSAGVAARRWKRRAKKTAAQDI